MRTQKRNNINPPQSKRINLALNRPNNYKSESNTHTHIQRHNKRRQPIKTKIKEQNKSK